MTMKKRYVQPNTGTVNIVKVTFLCNSYGVSSTKGIGYGGVDENDEYDPD
jgi:hypothetical protein